MNETSVTQLLENSTVEGDVRLNSPNYEVSASAALVTGVSFGVTNYFLHHFFFTPPNIPPAVLITNITVNNYYCENIPSPTT